jgi:hypothetical protein
MIASRENFMECETKEKLEQHLSDIRKLAARPDLTAEQREAAVRAELFAIKLVKEHDFAGHEGKRCPFATQIWPQR